MATMLPPEAYSQPDGSFAAHRGQLDGPAPGSGQPAPVCPLQQTVSTESDAWTQNEEMGFLAGQLLFPGNYHAISQLIGTRTEEEVQQLATADHPESHRLQKSLNLLRPANTFSNTDFRHWGLLQNVMGALKMRHIAQGSPAGEKNSNYHKEEAQHLIGDYIQGHLQLQEVTSYLTKHFGLSAYLEALLRSRKDGSEKSSPTHIHAEEQCCQHELEHHTWDQPASHAEEQAPARPEHNLRKPKGKAKTKTIKEKEAEKRELEKLNCLNCGVRWAPMPRQGMCNACGIYLTNNKRQRPLALALKLQKAEPWKFEEGTPPGHVMKKKDNGKMVAVPLEDLQDSPHADYPDNLPTSRPASAVFMTAEEEEEAVRRSSRQRRPPAHLSDDDHLASDAEPQSDDDKAPHVTRHFASRGFPQTFDEQLHGSDESDQSCYEDEDMYETNPPLSEEEVLERYAHTNWESPQDDHIMAKHLRYMQKSQTPVKTRKRIHEEMEEPCAFEAPFDAPARNSRPFLVVRRGPVQASQGPPKRQKEKRKPKDGGPCTNCGTTMSSMWRPHNSKYKSGPTRCNACGIYVTSYGMERPVDEHGNLDKAAAKRVSMSRANSRKRPCREGSIGSEATGQGFVPSRSSSLQAPPAPPAAYIPVPSAFAPKAASGGMFNIKVDACGGGALFFDTPHRAHHLQRQISAAGSGTLQRALFAAEKPRSVLHSVPASQVGNAHHF